MYDHLILDLLSHPEHGTQMLLFVAEQCLRVVHDFVMKYYVHLVAALVFERRVSNLKYFAQLPVKIEPN